MRILITDGDNRAALAITRSLGGQHELTVGAREQRSLASVSRYCHDAFAYPDPACHPQAFLDCLATAVHRHQIEVLLPVADITTILVAENRSMFEPHCRLPFPDADTVKRAANKVEIIALARQLGVPFPASVAIASPAEAMTLVPQLEFPLVVKPGRSRVQVNGHWLSTSVQYANDPEELRALLTDLNPAVFPVLLQERIRGPGIGMFYCYDRGRPIAAFAHRRLREKPPSGGVSVLRESVPIDPVADDHARRLLDSLGWHGVAMVEFKRDDRDGIPRLMEINGRFWGSLQLAIDAGVNFPELLIQTLGPGPTPQAVTSYRVGVQSRWLWGDIDALLMTLLKRSERRKLPASRRGRLQALKTFFTRQGRDCRFEVLRADDLKPWLLETWRWFIRG